MFCLDCAQEIAVKPDMALTSTVSPCCSRPFVYAGRRTLPARRQASLRRRLQVRMESGTSFPESLINQISVAVTNFSPANSVKKGADSVSMLYLSRPPFPRCMSCHAIMLMWGGLDHSSYACAGIAKMQAGSFDEAAVAAKVDGLIADNPVVVFSWTRWGSAHAV